MRVLDNYYRHKMTVLLLWLIFISYKKVKIDYQYLPFFTDSTINNSNLTNRI